MEINCIFVIRTTVAMQAVGKAIYNSNRGTGALAKYKLYDQPLNTIAPGIVIEVVKLELLTFPLRQHRMQQPSL